MGRCCSRPLTREEVEEETGTRRGRLRALLRRLRPGANSPLVEVLEDGESLSLHGRSISTAGHLVEGDDGEARKHRESLGERESETELLQNRISELTVSLSQAQDQLQAFQQGHDETVQQKDEAEASSRGQVAKLEARISELTESFSEAENELRALKQQHSEAEVSSHSHISRFQSQISELTDDRSRAERELAALKQNCDELTAALAERDKTEDCLCSQLQEEISQREAKISEPTGRAIVEEEHQQQKESETALHSQIAQLQEEISQCEAKISELTEGRAKVEEELQQREESEAALHSQIAQLQEEISQREAKISELTEGRAIELHQREESEAALHSHIAQLQEEISQREAKISELTDGRAKVEEELQQRKESEAALHSQIAQLQEEISQMESSLSAAEESRSLAESALAQLQQQHDRLKKSRSERPQANPELRKLVNELSEVTDWFHFGLQLNVPFSRLMIIKRITVPNDVLGKIYMLQEWLNIVWPEASWADIVAALVRIRMRGLAQRLAEKYGVPMPSVDDATLESQQGASNNEETQSTNTQLLAEIQRLHGKFDEQDKKITAINASLEIERSERHTAYENTLKSLGSVEDGQRELKSLKDQEMVIKEQLESKKRELHYLQQLLQFRTRENDELNTLIKSKQGEIEQLQSNLLKTEGKLESAQEEVKLLRDQLWQARRELWASHSRVQELERERAELQAEMNRERREVEHTLTQKAATLPTQEPAHEMLEYQHDQAMELLSESSGHEVTSRQEDSQREEQIRELLVRARKLESLRLTRWKCQDAPQPLARGSAAVDTDRHTVYFSDYRSIGAYEWQRERWSKLCDYPNYDHTLAVVGGLLTAVGGAQSIIYTNTLFSLVGDGSERRWEEHFTPMPTKRRWTAVVCSGKHLVVMGGEELVPLTTVEVLNTETRQWLTASSLPFPLSEASATIVGDNIYLVGGCDRSGWTRSVFTCSLIALLQSCQPHLLTSQSPPLWHKIADTPAYVSTCVTLNGELVVVGGCDSSYIPTDSVYAYDPVTDSWNVISHMNIARWECLAVVLPGDRLMVVGGRTSRSYSQIPPVEIATLSTV